MALPSLIGYTVTTSHDQGGRLAVKHFGADQRDEAWAYMRLCDAIEVPAGFPEPVWAGREA